MNHIIAKQRALVVVLLIALVFTGCNAPTFKASNPSPESSIDPSQHSSETTPCGSIAIRYLKELETLGPRVAGSESETQTAQWIKKQLEAMGYTVTLEPFDFKTTDGDKLKHSQNIIAVKTGQNPQSIILGAHYDSVSQGKGVDDNGSGVAVALEVAQSLSLKDTSTPQTIKFIFFGAEEVDLKGSNYHANRLDPETIKNTRLMINLDSLVAGNKAYVYGNIDEKGRFREHVLDLAEKSELTLITQSGLNPEYPAGTTGDWSDHAPFKAKELPFLYFESTDWTLGQKDGYTQVLPQYGVGGEIWHTQFDTYSYIEKNFPGRISERLSTFSHILQQLLAEDISEI